MSIDPPEAEWNRFRLRLRLRPDRSLSLLKIDRSTQKLTTGRIHYSMLDVRCSTFISFSFDLTGRSRPAAALYEATQNFKSEPQNIEQEISNDEGWNRCVRSFFKIDRIHYSMLDVRCSMFISFLFDLTGRSRPAAALI